LGAILIAWYSADTDVIRHKSPLSEKL
jgi:hypothetical protein